MLPNNHAKLLGFPPDGNRESGGDTGDCATAIHRHASALWARGPIASRNAQIFPMRSLSVERLNRVLLISVDTKITGDRERFSNDLLCG